MALAGLAATQYGVIINKIAFAGLAVIQDVGIIYRMNCLGDNCICLSSITIKWEQIDE